MSKATHRRDPNSRLIASRLLSGSSYAALVLLALPSGAYAQDRDRHWDPNGTSVGNGGDGTWDTSGDVWSPSGDGVSGPYTPWDNGILDNAIFEGTPGTVVLAEPITVHNITFDAPGYVLTGDTLTLAGADSTISVIGGTRGAVIDSVIVGNAGLTKDFAGTLTLNGANTFTGDVLVNAGTLVVNDSAALGDAANGLTLADGTAFTSAGSLAGRTITLLGGQATLRGGGVGTAHFTGAGGIRAAGSITLDDDTNDYAGQTSLVNGGNLYFSSIGDIGEASALGAAADAASGTISLGVGTYASAYARYTGDGDSSNRNWQLGSHFYQSSGIVNQGTGTLTLTGNIVSAHTASSIGVRNISFNAATANLELLGTISSNNNGVGVVFTGGAGRTITVGGVNTFGGVASIENLSVKVESLKNTGTASALGTGETGGIGIVNGVLSYIGSGDSSDRIFQISGNSTIANDGTGALALSGATVFLAGGDADTLMLGGSFTGTNTLSGAISGVGNLRSDGAGTWVVSGANTFAGNVIVDSGTLQAGSADAFGASSGLVVNGGTLDLGGFDLTVPKLEGAGGEVALGANTLTIDTTVNTAYAGNISGSGSLQKTGIGTLTLSGANSYTGETSITGGALELGFTSVGAPTEDIISSASTLDMSGGSLRIVGADGVANSQSFNGLNIAAGSNRISAASGTGGSVDVDFGAITRTGGLIDFALPESGSFTTSSASLGGWATVNGTDYAKVEAGGVIAAFTEADYSQKDDAANWLDGEVISDVGGDPDTAFFGTVSGTKHLGGLKYTAAAASIVTVDDGETLGIDGMIIVAPSVGATSKAIRGGSITGGAGGGTLGVLQNGTGTSTFIIDSAIVDNGGATGFTKAGDGIVRLTGNNSYTGATILSGGELQITTLANAGQASSIGAASADSSNLVLEAGMLKYEGTGDASTDRGFTLVNGGAEAPRIGVDADHSVEFSGLVTSPDDAGLTKVGWGELVLSNAANNYIGVTTIRGGGSGDYSTLSVNTLADGGSVSGIGAASSDSANLVLNTGGRLRYTGGTVAIDRGFTLESGGRIDVAQAGTTLTIDGTAVGTGGLVKDGAGTLVLTGTNTYTGGTIVNAGTLRAGSIAAFGPNTSPMGVNAGATFDLGGLDIKVGALNDGAGGGGDVLLGSATLSVGGTNGSFTGTISGTGGLTKTPGTTQVLSGGHNSYTGVTTFNGGTLSVGVLADGGVVSDIGASGSDAANMVFTGGRLTYTGGSTSIDRGFTLLSGDGYINVSNAATTLEFEGEAVGAGRLRKEGAGTLVLSGSNNLTGTMLIDGGILRAGSNDALGTAGLTLANVAGAALDLDGYDNTIGYLNGGGVTGGNILLGGATLTLNWASGNAAYAGAISGSGGLIKNGGVNQALSGCASDYTGATVINGGMLTVSCLTDGGAASSIGASSADASNLVINGATLRYTGTGGSTDRQFTLGASGNNALDASGTGAIAFTSDAALTFSSADTAQTLTLTGTNTGDNILAAELTNNGAGQTSLTKNGVGTWILTNQASTYTGATRIDGGVLGVDKLADGGLASSLGASTADASNLIIGNGSTLRYTGAGDTTNRLFTLSAGTTFIESAGTGAIVFTDTGPVTLAGDNLDRTIALGGSNTGNNTLAGSIGDAGTGVTILAKNDAGTWVLTGDNSYTGNTVINGGTLVLGNGGTTGSIVSNAINLGTLAFNRADSYTYGGVISNVGAVRQIGTGTTILTGDSTYTGGTAIEAGTLQLGDGGTTGSIVGDVANDGLLVFDRSNSYEFAGLISGTGGVTQNGTGTTILTAANTYTGVTTIAGGTLSVDTLANGGVASGIGASGNEPANLVFDGGTLAYTGDDIGIDRGFTLTGDGHIAVDVGTTLNFGGAAIGDGQLIKEGPGTLVLSGTGTYAGGTTISAGVLQLGAGGTTGSIVGDVANNGSLSFFRSDDIVFDGLITGTGSVVKNGAGSLTLTADNAYGGSAMINAGALIVNGDQSGAAGVTAVNGGATLGGTGIIGGDADIFGNLAPGDSGAGTLTIAGDLRLSDTSILDFEFGEANVVGGALNDLVNVGGDLRLDGTLNVTETAGGNFGGGIYRVFNYDGALTDNGLTLGAMPAGSDVTLQTSVAGQVNLVNSTGLVLSFWDGDAGPGFNDAIDGGSGTWHLGGTDNNWTDSAGAINAAWADGTFAVFAGTAGTVTVDNSDGPVTASGMQFASDGYLVDGGDIALVGPQSTIRVGDGTVAGAAMTATIASRLTGASQLVKTDDGTLVLTGDNTYTGGTAIDGGTLQLGNGGASGGILGDVINNGVLAFNRSSDRTFSGAIIGTGALTKQGAGTLTLTGVSTYTGATTLNAGQIMLQSGGRIDGTDHLTIDGGAMTVSGTGASLIAGPGDSVIADSTGSNGTLVVTDGGTASFAALYVGQGFNSVGELSIGAGSRVTQTGYVHFGKAGQATINISDGGKMVSSGTDYAAFVGGQVAMGNAYVTVSGTGSSWSTPSGLTFRRGRITIADGGLITAGDETIIGYSGAGLNNPSADMIVTGAGARFETTGTLTITNSSAGSARGALTIADGGVVKVGSGTLELGVGNAALNIGGEEGDAATHAGTLDAAAVTLAAAGNRINFNHDNADYQFSAAISGVGAINQLSGTTILTGDSAAFAGATFVTGGALYVNNALGGNVNVATGGTLGGIGTIGGNVTIADGGILAPGNSPGTLAIRGDLALTSGSILNYEFGEADVEGGTFNDLVTVGGDLTLGGTLNVTETAGGSFGAGVYRVFTYEGTLTDSGLALGTMPAGSDVTVQTAIGGQVNLVNAAGLQLSIWDGAVGPKFDGKVNGGDGVWQSSGGNDNWTNSNGTINAVYADGGFAIFQGAAGTVTVDNSLGAVSASGMQFTSDGYLIDGGDIALVGPQATIRVGVGSATDADLTATIASALTGATELVKTDGGTLVLTGDNSYSLGTTINSGTLQLGDGGTSGSIQGDVVNEGSLVFNRSNGLTFGGAISGTGAVSQVGAGTITLTADNTYSGDTLVRTGTMLLTGGGTIDGTVLTTVRDGGALTVSGNDSSLATAALAIGDVAGDSATLNVENGGTVGVTGAAPVIVGIAGDGIVTVDGAGSTFTVADALQLGGAASGLLNLTNGGQAFSASGIVGAGDGGGEALVSGPDSLWENTGNLTVGTYGAGKLTIGAGATVMNADGVIDSDASGEVIVTGAGSTWTNAGQLTVGSFGSGSLLVENGATVTSSQGYIGSGDTGNGSVTVTGAGSNWATTLNINVGNYGTGSLTIDDGALVRAALGVDLGLSAADAGGTLTVQGTAASRGILETSQIRGGLGTANVLINGGIIRAIEDNADFVSGFGAQAISIGTDGAEIDTNGHDIGIAARFTGAGDLVKFGAGTLVLSGANDYLGTTTVNDGALLVNGDQSAATGPTSVGSATLGGIGTIGGDVTVVGGTINPGALGNAPGTLTINGGLTLDGGSTLAYNFGQAGVAGGAFNDLIEVGGDLTLDGTLNVDTSASGDFDPGVYRVISYGGGLTDNGLSIGTIPSPDFYVQTTVPGQVNLVNTEGMTLRYWDGDAIASKNSGTIEGGDGVWQSFAGNDNWTEQTGAANAPFTDAAFAVFAGAAGTVSVDESLGAINASGMQFLTDGYVIQGDAINLAGAPASVIRVGDGTAAGAGVTATIASALTGAAQLVKTDLGTLILSGTNGYTGGTAINGGTLQIAADANLGDEAGGLGFDGGTLHTTADIATGRAVDLAGAGTFLTDTGTVLTVNGAISGAGSFTKDGAGTLVLTGTNAYAGATTVAAGTLLVNGDQSGAAGVTTVAAGGTLGGTGIIGGDVAVAGTLAAGSNGVGTLTIDGGLELASGSMLDFEFGEAGVAGGSLNDLVNVGGDLVLDGTINVSVPTGGSFGPGIYRVFNYGGSLTDNGLALGTMPGGLVSVQTAIAGQVNLVNTAGLALSFWDGDAGPKNNAAVDGGDGVWRVGGGVNDWTDMDGSVNADYAQDSFAIFSGASGTVTIDNVGGGVLASGMQFASDGYVLTGDALTLTGAEAIIQVGDSSAASAGYTATIDAELSGTAQLVKTDAGTLVLTGLNSYTGGTAINGGTVQIAADANLGDGAGGLSLDGGTLHTTADMATGRAVDLAGAGVFLTDMGTTLALDGLVSGAGSLAKDGAGTLVLTGNDSYAGGTTIVGGTLQLGDGGTSGAVVGNLANNGALVFNRSDAVTFGGAISGSGSVDQFGAGTLILTASNSYTGGTTISAGRLQLGDGGTSGSIVGDVVDNGVLAFDRSDDIIFAGSISGSGSVEQIGAGTTILTGTNSYAGTTDITAGTLLVNGDQSAAEGLTSVASGATLGGTGIIGGDVTLAGVLATGSSGVGTLTIDGDLTLGSGSRIAVELGEANVPGGPLNDLVNVGGDLTLGGTVDVAVPVGGDFGPGVYRLINYAGALTDNGLTVGAVPGGADAFVQTAVANQVNLVNTAGLTLNFWDGAAGPKNDGAIDGGDGVWRVGGGANPWTESSGAVNADYAQGSFVIFQAAPGAVTIDNSGGDVLAAGMQFTSDGYVIDGDALTLTGTDALIRVGDGSAADAGITATIDAALGGSTRLVKDLGGTLVLTGLNSYTGGTAINGGTVQIAADANLGAAAGGLSLDGGTLHTTADIATGRAVDLAGAGVFLTDAGTTLALDGLVLGAGSLAKDGAGTLVLTGNDSYAGGTTIVGGTLQLGDGGTTGSILGDVANNGVLAFNRSDEVTFAGAISGGGSVSQIGTGTTILTADNSYTGGTTITAGMLQLGGGGTTGSILGDVVNNGVLAFNRSDAATFAGLISGTGGIEQAGPGMTILTGGNSYAGATNINAGMLLVNGDQSMATGLTSVASGATLGGTGTVGGDVTVADGGILAPGAGGPGTLTINGDLTLGGSSTLAYDFGQAGVVGGAFNDLIDVGGDLTLDGTIDVAVSPGGSFDIGLYRIADYGGTLTDRGLAIGAMPAGGKVFVQTAIGGQVNLVNTGSATLNFWDGAAGPKFDGAVNGGDGVWQSGAGNDNWADMNGAVNAPYADGAVAIFSAAAGTVTIDNGSGAVTASGMQFASDGYVLTGDALTLTAAQSVIRVGDGTAAGAGYTATIDAELSGTAQLVKTDAGTLVLTGLNSYTGGTAINGGTVQIAADANLGDGAGGLSLDGGTLHTTADMATGRAVDLAGAGVFLTDTGTTLTLDGAVSGAGSLTKNGAGTLVLAGSGSNGGGISVSAGTLWVNGDFADATGLTSVASGATLGGTGTIGGDVALADGAILTPGAGGAGTLAIGGSLSLAAGSSLAFEFGEANVAGGALNDLVTVDGDLTLDGTLDVTVPAGGAFDAGIYRVFDYGGALTDNGLALGAMPAGSNVAVQTSIAGQVNLVNSAGLTLNFWDGAAGPRNDGVTQGGSGTWQNGTGNDNWTDADGTVNAAYSDGAFAVFGGTGGKVTVDDGLGAVTTGGMQFAADDYTIDGDALVLADAATTVRVGDGSTAGADMTATIDAALTGDSQLVKTDAGTLILGGANSYTGGTAINGGTLQIGADGNLGDEAGGVTLNGGTLATTADLSSGREIVLAGDSAIATAGDTTFTFDGPLSGTGALTKQGAGTLLLTGDNGDYTATTTIAVGTLAVDGVLGGAVAVDAGARLEGSGRVGDVANAGIVAPGTDGFGTLTVDAYAGKGGVLEIETALGGDTSETDRLVVTGGTSGSTEITVANRGGLGAQTVEGIKLIDVTGGASDGTFALRGDYVFEGDQAVIAGAYGYRLYQGGVSTPTDGDWYLRSALLDGPDEPTEPLYQPGVPIYENYAQTLQTLGNLPTMQERVGNRRWASSENGTANGIWGRMESSRLRPEARTSTTASDVDINNWQLQMGFDRTLMERGGSWLVAGLTAHYGEADGAVRSVFGNGEIDTKGYGIGATLTWYAPDGFYADGQAQFSWFDGRLKSSILGTLTDNNDGRGEAFSLEVGKRSPIGGGFTLTPQIQAIYQNVDFDAFDDPSDARVSSHNGDSLKTRWGISIDHDQAWDANGSSRRTHLYGLLNVSYEWLDGSRVDVSGTPIRTSNDRLWGEAALGGSLGLGDRLTIYTQVSASSAFHDLGESYTLKGVAGVRLAF